MVTIYKAVESARRTLYAEGPEILRYLLNGEARLQTWPGPDDTSGPHFEGRALDIVLLAERDSECSIADALISGFLTYREEIAWEALIYNREEWNSEGSKSPRILSPNNPNPGRDFEHRTHIHMQWPSNKKDIDVSYAVALSLARDVG